MTWRKDPVGKIKQFIWVENRTPETTILCVEPWAEEVRLAPKSGVVLTVRSRFPGYLEVVYETDRITVWAWSGCRVWIRGRDGNPSVDLDVPVPDLPGTPFRRGFPDQEVN